MKKIFLNIVLVFIGIFFISTKVYAGNISLINQSVPANLYLYDTLSYGKDYYDFNFTFKVADNPPDMGTPAQVNAVVYFEADINGKSVDLNNAILKNGDVGSETPATTKYNNRIMVVMNIIAADYKGVIGKRTVRIPMALISSVTKDNNVPLNWKIYNGNDYNEKYASGTIKLATDPVTDTPVPVTPKVGDVTNKTKYTFLAPLGSIKCMDSSGQDKTCIGNNIGEYLNFIFKFAIGLCAALAVLMLIMAGITYMGDESIFGKTEAKHKMMASVGGLLIALAAWALLNTINPDLTGSGNINITGVSIKLEPTSGGGYYGVVIGSSGGANANKNVTEYDAFLKNASQKYGVECTLIKAFMYAESGGVNGLTSPAPANAKGLIQLTDATFKEQNVGNNPMDPQTNINAGASYLSKLKNNGCNGSKQSSVCDISNIQYLAASYNGGPGANKESNDCKNSTIWQCTNNDGYAQTRTYAPRVEANYNKLKEKGWGC